MAEKLSMVQKLRKKNRLLIASLLLWSVLNLAAEQGNERVIQFLNNRANWRYISFDRAMQSNEYPRAIQITEHVVGIDGQDFLDFCKKLYEKNNPVHLPLT